jgi:hypothetical protein
MRKLGLVLLCLLVGCSTTTTGSDTSPDVAVDTGIQRADQTSDLPRVTLDAQSADQETTASDWIDGNQPDPGPVDQVTGLDQSDINMMADADAKIDTVGDAMIDATMDLMIDATADATVEPDTLEPTPDVVPTDFPADETSSPDIAPPDAAVLDVDTWEEDAGSQADVPPEPLGLPWELPDWQANCDSDLCVTEEACLSTQCQQGMCIYNYAQACDLGSCESPLEFQLGPSQNDLHITLPGSETSALPFNVFEPCLAPPGAGARYLYRFNLVEDGWVALSMTGGSPIPNQFSMGIRTSCDGTDGGPLMCGIAQGVIANLTAGSYYAVITHWLSPGELPSSVSWFFTLNAYYVSPDEMPF